jgi:hypothetical protein
MNHYPGPDERDWKGVCQKCGKMGSTIVINLLEDKDRAPKKKEELKKSREYYRYLGRSEEEIDEILGDEYEPEGDFREVTKCCKSEDMIPAIYAVKCEKCGQWYDERRGCCS